MVLRRIRPRSDQLTGLRASIMSSSLMTFQIEGTAPAKINLCLRILRRRENGYHDLESIMVPLGWGDDLQMTMEPNSTFEVHFQPILENDQTQEQAGLPANADDNLVVRAAKTYWKALQQQSKSVQPCTTNISLRKNVPVGAGLGGGSSDAAWVLNAMQQYFEKPFSPAQMNQLATQLGADVPFFLEAKPAFVEGIGERISVLKDFPNFWVVLVHPGFGVSTAWVYQNLQLPGQGHPSISHRISNFQHEIVQNNWESWVFNDLEAVTAQKYPQIDEIKKTLVNHGARISLMSGSGSVVFGIFSGDDAQAQANQTQQKLKKHKSWNVFCCPVRSE